MKTKINDRFAKKYCLQTLKQVSKCLRLLMDEQKNMKNLKLKKSTKKRFNETNLINIVNYHKYLSLSREI